jgi:hypothetical protein
MKTGAKMPIFKLKKTKVNVWIWLDEKKGFNEWYECSHWTYEENHGWLIERGIVAFHWSNSQRFSFIETAGKIECHMGKSQKIPSRPRGASEEKTREKPGEKKGAEKYLPYTSLTSLPIMSFPMTSYPVTFGETMSGDIISGDVTAPPQIRARSSMTYYLCSFIQFASFLWKMNIF